MESERLFHRAAVVHGANAAWQSVGNPRATTAEALGPGILTLCL